MMTGLLDRVRNTRFAVVRRIGSVAVVLRSGRFNSAVHSASESTHHRHYQ